MFVLPRVSLRKTTDPFNLENVLNMPRIKSEPLSSNIYSPYERIILTWLNKHYEKNRKIVWKDGQKGDFFSPLYSHFYIPFVEIIWFIEISWQLATESFFWGGDCLPMHISISCVSGLHDECLLTNTVQDLPPVVLCVLIISN